MRAPRPTHGRGDSVKPRPTVAGPLPRLKSDAACTARPGEFRPATGWYVMGGKGAGGREGGAGEGRTSWTTRAGRALRRTPRSSHGPRNRGNAHLAESQRPPTVRGRGIRTGAGGRSGHPPLVNPSLLRSPRVSTPEGPSGGTRAHGYPSMQATTITAPSALVQLGLAGDRLHLLRGGVAEGDPRAACGVLSGHRATAGRWAARRASWASRSPSHGVQSSTGGRPLVAMSSRTAAYRSASERVRSARVWSPATAVGSSWCPVRVG